MADVEALAQEPVAAEASAPSVQTVPEAASAAPQAPAAPTPQVAVRPPAKGRKAAIRAAVARKMTPSATIPQFTVWRELELDSANTQRRGISWTTVLLRAYAAALRDVPDLLSRWEDDQATESGPPAIALAVATDRGLLVPTLTEPDLADAHALDAEIRAVVKAAHTGKLDPSYMAVANGSISNLGGMGVDRFQALLTPPQAQCSVARNDPATARGGSRGRRARTHGARRHHRRPPSRRRGARRTAARRDGTTTRRKSLTKTLT